MLFVSHSADALKSTCDRAIYLKDGGVEFDGTVDDALERYNADIEEIRRVRREKKEARRQRVLEKRAKKQAKLAAQQAEQSGEVTENDV